MRQRPQKKRLWDKWNIQPLIDTRFLWQAEKEEPGYDPGRPITTTKMARLRGREVVGRGLAQVLGREREAAERDVPDRNRSPD